MPASKEMLESDPTSFSTIVIPAQAGIQSR